MVILKVPPSDAFFTAFDLPAEGGAGPSTVLVPLNQSRIRSNTKAASDPLNKLTAVFYGLYSV